MAIDDLDSLREVIPRLFENQPVPTGWEDDWLFTRVDDPESVLNEPDVDMVPGDMDVGLAEGPNEPEFTVLTLPRPSSHMVCTLGTLRADVSTFIEGSG